jgi:hypothetical protein
MPKSLSRPARWHAVEKRIVLSVATFALISVAAFVNTRPTHAQVAGFASQVEGTWLTTVTIENGPLPFPTLLTFGSGGALIVTDSGVPPAQGNVYQGTWVRTGGNEIAFSFLGMQYTNGVLSGYIRVHETIRGEGAADAYASVGSTIEGLDVNMNVVFTARASTHGIRLRAR